MVKAVYLHIPFCEQICYYCDFNKFFLKNQPINDYLHAMKKEMEYTLRQWTPNEIETIFVGGGTPTSLSIKQLDFFLNNVHQQFAPYIKGHIEFTFEANPGHLSEEKLQLLRDAGVNRISFGVQVLDDKLLKKIGRTHRTKDVYETIDKARKVGFQNINVDLIYNLPGQTVENFQETLRQAFALEVEHFSGYSLQIEPKTVFYQLHRKGKLSLPTEDEEVAMYTLLLEEMAAHGYDQYEISNFAKPGYESKHNLTYWHNEEYYGLGAGAHSYMNGVRRRNAGPINQYISLIHERGNPYVEEMEVTVREQMEEEIFLGLRTKKGVSKEIFQRKFGQSLIAVFEKEIMEQRNKGLLEITPDTIRLTKRGLFLGNEVFQAFIEK